MWSEQRGDLPRMVSWTRAEVLSQIESAIGLGVTITYAHCETVRRSLRDARYLEDIHAVDYCFVDGVGAQLASLLAHGRWPARSTSDDFVRDIWRMAAARGLRVALVGGMDGVAQRSVGVLQDCAPLKPVLVADGRLDGQGVDGLASRIAETAPDIVLLGMGQPLQERVAVALAGRSPRTVILCVGGLFDVLRDGPVCPRWIRRAGFEWAVRLSREPTKVWRRYLLGPPETVARITLGHLRRSAAAPQQVRAMGRYRRASAGHDRSSSA